MTGRLRLDKLANLIEAFLGESLATERLDAPADIPTTDVHGPLYFQTEYNAAVDRTPEAIQKQEMESAVPLSEVLMASSSQGNLSGPLLPHLRRISSLSIPPNEAFVLTTALPMRSSASSETPSYLHQELCHEIASTPSQIADDHQGLSSSMRERRPLVNRRAASDLDRIGMESNSDVASLDYLTVPGFHGAVGAGIESRNVPLIPFDELMLIETMGTGRVSTIYRAAWQRAHMSSTSPALATTPGSVHMVALKVAMVNAITGDTSHVDELRREADIAARLHHPNICDLVGIAADPECFCLAYDFCEGGSLLSLLSDSRRYYEYLPIAMDIANGMAYLHSRSVIHRYEENLM